MVRQSVFVTCVAMLVVWDHCLGGDIDMEATLRGNAKIAGLGEKEIQNLKGNIRSKRSTASGAELLYCRWGYWDFLVRSYYLPGYGCYCGSSFLGGASVSDGYDTVDKIDECCLEHDICWNNAAGNTDLEYDYNLFFTVFTVPCTGNYHSYEFSWSSSQQTCVCDSGQGGCASALCECDVAFADCIADEWEDNFDWTTPSCPGNK
ncbi:uncharacterized protein [Amphiura filiformis]|uniref:uncharacterized protein n=1 Tax=Amphiura filiformis TaxID=82378 RepID=UPI003B219103